MMAGNPNYWSMNDMHPLQLSNPQFVYANNNNNPSLLTSQSTDHHHRHHPTTQDYPVRSWSQLLQGGGDEEEGYEGGNQVLNLNNSIVPNNFTTVDHHHHHHHQAMAASISGWPPRVVPVSSSPTSCVTSLSNNFLSFSGAQENSSECNSTSTGGVPKKARVQQSSSQPPLKVRKEKLGDRITALHQLVSPFGKTDTASVLSEAIGYIRFLQTQIQALSTPYMRNPSANSVQERNCLFPEEGVGEDLQSREAKDLRSRGLCLLPISCTDNVGDHDNGADYWAPTALGGGF